MSTLIEQFQEALQRKELIRLELTRLSGMRRDAERREAAIRGEIEAIKKLRSDAAEGEVAIRKHIDIHTQNIKAIHDAISDIVPADAAAPKQFQVVDVTPPAPEPIVVGGPR